MKILVVLETSEGQIKKSSLEALGYGNSLAQTSGGSVTALVLGNNSAADESLGEFGAQTVLKNSSLTSDSLNLLEGAALLKQALEDNSYDVVVSAKSSFADGMLPRVAASVKGAMASNVVSQPDLSNGFVVTRSIYTGKAFAKVSLESGKVKFITIRKGAGTVLSLGTSASVIEKSIAIPSSQIKITGTEKATGEVLLPEADIVVSGGRGLKGPENWHLITNLAKTLGAATACSKPVSDADWRPHHEHVGQTGVKVSPSLYIAVGISGAIQHVAGISSSKCIVAINSDPEAPIFKAADYGIVGNAFEVVPKLQEAFEKALS